MLIRNQCDTDIHYEIRGGPLRMTMSECDLLPGEHEEWHNPDPRGGRVQCEVFVVVGDYAKKVATHSDATVVAAGTVSEWTLTVSTEG